MNRSNQLPNLEKLFKDDDEQDFSPLGGSNLAAIFGTSNKSIESNVSTKTNKKLNASKSTPQSTPSSSQTEVILAKAVHAYELQNGQYKLIGKVGIALTANISSKTYLLILYKSNREHISVLTLTAKFKFAIQENNYVSYYDGYNNNWSILFDSSENCIDFSREVGVSKYLLQHEKNDDSIFYQDLTVSSKENEAKEGDNIHLKYSIITHITQPLKVSAIPIQDMVVQISTDDNWERSLLGVTKGLKRVLFLPPSKQISLGPGFPRERDIALEIEIINIVPPDDKKSPTSRSRTSGGKASLISRMAKMGQSILPQKPMSTTDSEDTEEESHIKSPRRVRNFSAEASSKAFSDVHTSSSESQESSTRVPTNVAVQHTFIPPSANPSPHGTLVPTGTFTPSWPTAPLQQQYMSTADGQLYSFPATVQPFVDPNVNVFLSETRTHNAEIRMGMSKIADNVQKLLDKFHALELQNATSPNNEKALETLKMLLTLNSNRNNQIVHEAVNTETNLKTKDDLYLEKIKSLEDALRITNNSLEDSSDKLKQTEIDKQNFNRERVELVEKIQELESSLHEAHDKLQKSLLNIKIANDNLIDYKERFAKFERRLTTFKPENKSLEKSTHFKEKTSTIHEEDEKSEEIKIIMKKMLLALLFRLQEKMYHSDDLLYRISDTMESFTLQSLKEHNNQVEKLSDDRKTKHTKADETSTIDNSKEVDVQNYNKEKIELIEKIQELESSLHEAHDKLQKSLLNIKIANDNLIDYKERFAKFERRLTTFKPENKSLEKSTHFKEKTSIHKGNIKSAEIESIKNKTLLMLKPKFEEECYYIDEIILIISDTIKSITSQWLEKNSKIAEAKEPICLPVLDKSFNFEVDEIAKNHFHDFLGSRHR